MHRCVELLIGRLVTDPDLRRRFAASPEAVLDEQGLEFTDLERIALAAADPEVFQQLADALDDRLIKAARVAGKHSAGS